MAAAAVCARTSCRASHPRAAVLRQRGRAPAALLPHSAQLRTKRRPPAARPPTAWAHPRHCSQRCTEWAASCKPLPRGMLSVRLVPACCCGGGGVQGRLQPGQLRMLLVIRGGSWDGWGRHAPPACTQLYALHPRDSRDRRSCRCANGGWCWPAGTGSGAGWCHGKVHRHGRCVSRAARAAGRVRTGPAAARAEARSQGGRVQRGC
mmetsp:Transcript_29363/g.74849  ORF Transcript_29363/g.74849 Transcript_29363/m.74849 type:complete len:206 (+) Transcript_29363:470-1087(+)